MLSYFNEDLDRMYGSLTGAIDAVLSNSTLEYKRDLLKEWRDWNASEGTVNDIRPFLYDGFSVNICFQEAIDARNFMNRIYDELMGRVKAATRHVTP